jgi:hypothetical protein
VEHASATAWIIAAAGQVSHAALGTFELSLQASSANDADDAVGTALPASWSGNSSAQGFLALGLLADEAKACKFPLGAQQLRLARVAGAASC